ncbi:uncharacterized protein LOC129943003 [Eupeodes corollae]|uniref:uncharacterized protein LOC129943003 n=1 Tax=Eupeodes corollae TaxID=290404 RepID=UPI0024937A99|nr:uncharacterized protein LOC129943003 [Eupeodes corollae]XP_055908180.1 uncharacterized protein LOC129943003 [Eupeodes corollae]
MDVDVSGDLGNGDNEEFVVNFDCDIGRVVNVEGADKDISNTSFLEAERVILQVKDSLESKHINSQVVLTLFARPSKTFLECMGYPIEGTFEVACDGTLLRVPQPNLDSASLQEKIPQDYETVIGTMELEIENDNILQEIPFQIIRENALTMEAHTSKSAENPSVFEKHLKYPKSYKTPSKYFLTLKNHLCQSHAWNAFQKKNKEDENKFRAAEGEKRKFERQMKTEGKKKTNKRKKTVRYGRGCDSCKNWFHLQCTNLSTMPCADAELQDFTCCYF